MQVNGLVPRARDVVDGRRIRVPSRRACAEETGIAAEKLPLDIVHQDAARHRDQQAAGLVVHPGAGNREHTLQNALLAHDAKLKRVPRAGLVHRIDKDTSGLLVVARTLEAHTALVAELAAHEIEREYLAVCTGAMTGGGTVDEPIGRHRTQRTKMTVRSDGRDAVTHYRIEKTFPRAHAGARAARDRPHAPDPRAPRARRVSDRRRSGVRRAAQAARGRVARARARRCENFHRQALHAARLTFTHPKSGKRV